MNNPAKNAIMTVVLVLAATAAAVVVTLGGYVTVRGKKYGVAGMQRGTAVAAIVNGEIIYTRELDSRVAAIAQQTRIDLQSQDGGRQRAEISRVVLDQIIEQRVILQEARRHSALAPDEQIDVEVAELKRNLSSEREFQEALRQRGLTLADLREQLRTNHSIRNLMAKVTPATVGDAEIETFFREHRSEFDRPEQVRVRHILVDSESEARLVLAKLQRGAKFEVMARLHSKDPGSKELGGELPFVSRGQLVAEFEQAAFTLQPREISGVVKTQYGYHIIQLIERRSPRTATLDQVRKLIQSQLMARKQEASFQEWLKQIKAKARITRTDQAIK